MELDTSPQVLTETNLPQNKVKKMVVNEEGLQHIMDLLTNLYKNPMQSVVREYVCNALDAHAAVGSTEKVKVKLPTWDKPTFVVTDHGIGMSEQNIWDIYAEYGASTKRNSNNQIGAFGLGCKSALALTNQFTLVSTKNHMRTTAVIAKEADGTNSVTIVSVTETDQPNGTTVRIPVSDPQGFIREAREVLKYMLEKVEVSGTSLTSAFEEKELSTSPSGHRVWHAKTSYWNAAQFVVMMGNVAYPADYADIYKSIPSDIRNTLQVLDIIVEVNIGDVNLTPSREALRFTDKTVNKLKEILDGLSAEIIADYKKSIDEAPTLREHFVRLRKCPVRFAPTWRGSVVPTFIPKEDIEVRYFFKNDSRKARVENKMIDTFRIENLNQYTFITGLKEDNEKKFLSSLAAIQRNERVVMYVDVADTDILKNKWVKDSEPTILTVDEVIKKAEEYRAEERADRGTPTPRGELLYPVLDVDECSITWSTVPDLDDDILFINYASVKEESVLRDTIIKTYNNIGWDFSISEHKVAGYKEVLGASKIVFIGGGRSVDAFLKRVPKAKSALTVLQENLEKHFDDFELVSIFKELSSSSGIIFNALKVTHKIDDVPDPLLSALKKYANLDKNSTETKIINLRGDIVGKNAMNWERRTEVLNTLANRYPLLQAVPTHNMSDEVRDELRDYMKRKFKSIDFS